MRLAALVLLVIAGCADPPAVARDDAFVRRSGPVADSLRVGRADTLAVRFEADLLDGAVAWRLTAPDGRAALAGAARDTVVEWRTASPVRGVWRFEVVPDSAIGLTSLSMRAR